MKKTISHACLALLMSTLGASIASATTETITAGSGTLSYTVTTTPLECEPEPLLGTEKPYLEYTYSAFSYTVSGTTTQLAGTDQSFYDPYGGEGTCPVSSYPSITFFLPSVEKEILFTPGLAGGGIANVSGLLYPKYYISSILYAPPGNKSSVTYTASTTYATTTSIGSSFASGDTETYTQSYGFMGFGVSTSESYGTTTTNGNNTTFTTSISQATGVGLDSVSTNPNTISHLQDAFVLWLNPAISVLQTGETTALTYGMGTQIQTGGDPSPGQPEAPDLTQPIVAQVLMASSTNGGLTTVPVSILEPQVVEQNGKSETLPGLASICANPLPASQGTFENQYGCVPSDFTPILDADPIRNLTSTKSPMTVNTDSLSTCTNPSSTAKCRFVPIMMLGSNDEPTDVQVNVKLDGPQCATCDPTPDSFTETDANQTTTALSESYSFSVGFSWSAMWTILGSGPKFQDSDTWTWAYTEGSGETNSTAHTMQVNLQSDTVGCGDPGVTVYEDTVFHTFAFQQTPGNTTCP